MNTQMFYIDVSAMFDSGRYRSEKYEKILRQAGAQTFITRIGALDTNPEVVGFIGISEKEARNALTIPEFDFPPIIHPVDWNIFPLERLIDNHFYFLYYNGAYNFTIVDQSSQWNMRGSHPTLFETLRAMHFIIAHRSENRVVPEEDRGEFLGEDDNGFRYYLAPNNFVYQYYPNKEYLNGEYDMHGLFVGYICSKAAWDRSFNQVIKK